MHQLGEDNRKLVWCIPSLPQSVEQENWPFYARHVPWPLLRHLPGVHLLVWAPSEPQFSDQRKRAWLTVTLEAEFCVTCLNDEPAHFCHQVLETATALLLCGQCCTHVRIPVMKYQYCHRGGPHMRSLISVDFPAPEMEPESAHVGISCLRSLAPMWRFAMQQHPGNIHQSFATPRYSATPCYVLIQLTNVIDTISKRWRSKKAFNTSPSHIFS